MFALILQEHCTSGHHLLIALRVEIALIGLDVHASSCCRIDSVAEACAHQPEADSDQQPCFYQHGKTTAFQNMLLINLTYFVRVYFWADFAVIRSDAACVPSCDIPQHLLYVQCAVVHLC